MLNFIYVILCGIALPIGGVQMQYLWRNQLGDIYSLGLGSAACLGAAAGAAFAVADTVSAAVPGTAPARVLGANDKV